jgi:hypothetical protein
VERFKHDNLILALEAANWKIKGPDGATELGLVGETPALKMAVLLSCCVPGAAEYPPCLVMRLQFS